MGQQQDELPDWVPAPNIAGDPEVYELENEALARDGRLDEALHRLAPWDGRRIVDIGCGTGFWLERYAATAERVIGIEPDPALLRSAAERVRGLTGVSVERGSAEHLPVADGSADIVHARFAYFFGPGGDDGLAEVARVLAPGGVLLAIDNSWSGGDFVRLLRSATGGNAEIDPELTDRWWAERGAVRHEIHGGWMASSRAELDRILRIEFSDQVVDAFMAHHRDAHLSYRFAVHVWRP